MPSKPKKYIIEQTQESDSWGAFGDAEEGATSLTDAIKVTDKGRGRRVLHELTQEGLDMHVLETTGVHEFEPIKGERIKVRRIA